MKSVLMLDTGVGSLNMGDEIIDRSISLNWPEIFENNYIMRLPTHTPPHTLFQSMLYKNKNLAPFVNADFKFLCGTNLLYTSMARPLPSWNINIFNTSAVRGAICLGTGIGVNSQKVGLYTRSLYNKVLSSNFVHSTRDERTKTFLEDLGFRAVNTGCPTLWGLTDELCQTIPRSKSEEVAFTLTGYHRDPVRDREMIDILLKNYRRLLFWPQCIADLDYLAELTSGDEGICIIPANVDAFARVLDSGVDYVGSRLHGGIFALQHGCRSIILSIDYRAHEMSKSYSLPCIERSETGEKLEDMVCGEWATRISGLDRDVIDGWKAQFLDI